jgi:Glycosyl transferases group 1
MQDIQSQGERLDVDFGGSDLSYFILPPSAMSFGEALDDKARYLFQATDPATYGFSVEHPIFDFSFIGQMFAPIPEGVRGRAIVVNGVDCGTVGQLLDIFAADGISQSSHMMQHTRERLLSFVRRRAPDAEVSMVDPAIRIFFDDYFPRVTERTRMLDTVLDVSDKVGFFGTGPWEKWPRYQPHFGGYIHRPSKMALVFKRTKLNLHNGNFGMHSRVLDCMAAGGAIMVNKSLWAGTGFGLDAYFEPGRHYIEYDFDNLAEVAAEALANDAGRRQIGAAAAEAVRAGHTWRDRVAQIIEEVRAL